MQQFTVPQFLDVEDKIIGPITTRQFLIMLVGTIAVAAFWNLFDFSLFVTLTIIDALICFILGFIKINGRPFHFFILNFIQTIKKHRLRVWQQGTTQYIGDEEVEIRQVENIPTKNVNLKSSRLNQMSLIVDTYGQYKGEDLIDKQGELNKENGGK